METKFVTNITTHFLADLNAGSSPDVVHRSATTVELEITGGSDPYVIPNDRIDEVTDWLTENDVDHVIEYPARRFVSVKPKTISMSLKPITLIIPRERETEFVLRWSEVLDLGEGE